MTNTQGWERTRRRFRRTGVIVASSIAATGITVGSPPPAGADITPNHDTQISTNACEDILLGWLDGQILDNLTNRYGVPSVLSR